MWVKRKRFVWSELISACVMSTSDTSTPSNRFLDLPDEVIDQIAAHLDRKSVLFLALVNRSLQPVARRNTLFSFDGTRNRSGRLLSLLEEHEDLGPSLRHAEFEPLDFLQPLEPPKKAVFHLFKQIISLCPNLQSLVIHRLPDDVATQGPITGIAGLTQLKRLELGTSRPPTTNIRETVDIKVLNPAFPADLFLWTLRPLTKLRHVSAIVGKSLSAALLPKMAAAEPLRSLRTVSLTLREPIGDADVAALASRSFPNATSITVTLEDNPSITTKGMSDALQLANENLRELIVTESTNAERGTYLDDALLHTRFPRLSTAALDLSRMSAAAVRKLPASLTTLALDVSYVEQSVSEGATSVLDALLEKLIKNEAFLPRLTTFIVIGVQKEAGLRIRLACAKREPLRPTLVPL